MLCTLSGQQFRFNMPGPALTEAEWQACLHKVQQLNPLPGYLVLSGGLPPDVPGELFDKP